MWSLQWDRMWSSPLFPPPVPCALRSGVGAGVDSTEIEVAVQHVLQSYVFYIMCEEFL